MKYNRANTIEEYKKLGCVLDVLKAIQAEEGYLSADAIKDVAAAYGKYPSEIYETATFYSMLSVNKKAEHTIEVCGSTCCDASGAKQVMSAITEELGVNLGEITPDKTWFFKRCECLGRCDTAPNVVIDGELYTHVTKDQVVEIIRKAGK